MLLTKKQISEQMRKHAEKKNGFQDLIEIMLESMMPAERGEKIRVIRVTDTVPAIVTAKARDLSSASHVTVMATSIRGFWPYCATRRKNATVWPASFIPRA